MKLDLFDYLNFCIFVIGLMSLFRWNAVEKTFHPFLIFILTGCINDALSYVLVANGYETILNNNIYMLLEALLLLWYFEKGGFFERHVKLVPITALLLLGAWIAEMVIAGSTQRVAVYFRIIYAFAVVLMSISTINNLLVRYSSPVLKNAVFMICVGFVSFYTLNILANAFWLYGLNKSNRFLMNIYYVLLTANFITNLIYGAAILLMLARRSLMHLPVHDH